MLSCWVFSQRSITFDCSPADLSLAEDLQEEGNKPEQCQYPFAWKGATCVRAPDGGCAVHLYSLKGRPTRDERIGLGACHSLMNAFGFSVLGSCRELLQRGPAEARIVNI